MKIIGTSNYNSELIDDVLVCTGINEKAGYGQEIVDHFNVLLDDTYYYKLVPDDYVLYEFKP